jgi:hypothetical protein
MYGRAGPVAKDGLTFQRHSDSSQLIIRNKSNFFNVCTTTSEEMELICLEKTPRANFANRIKFVIPIDRSAIILVRWHYKLASARREVIISIVMSIKLSCQKT